jgi:hypothetical protein
MPLDKKNKTRRSNKPRISFKTMSFLQAHLKSKSIIPSFFYFAIDLFLTIIDKNKNLAIIKIEFKRR